MDDPTRMFNIDETFINCSDNKVQVLTCEKPGTRQHCFTQNAGVNDKSGVTSLIMVNAAGDYVDPMIIMKRSRINDAAFKSQFGVRDADGNQLSFTVGKTDRANEWITAEISLRVSRKYIQVAQ